MFGIITGTVLGAALGIALLLAVIQIGEHFDRQLVNF